MKRILFVDDEVSILDGLKRMLRPMRTEWEMSFAPGGEPADFNQPGFVFAGYCCGIGPHDGSRSLRHH